MGISIRTRGRLATLVLAGALGGGLVRAGDGRSPKPPQAPKPPAKAPEAPAAPAAVAGRSAVNFPAGDGVLLSATYASQKAAKGAPALVLVHGQGQTRAAFQALFDELDEYRVPWLALDLRGHGASTVQGGQDLSALARARDPAFQGALDEDLWGAFRYLVDVQGHDPAAIGFLASELGASAALKAARVHKGEVAALMCLTASKAYAGFDTKADVEGLDGKMDLWFLASVQDMNREEKQGTRHLLYVAERARNAPPDTPLDERILKRRGIPPHLRAFAEKGIPGTAMIGGVAHLDAWIAAWWARRLGTLPHAVLFDGSVDVKGDYGDPEWAAGVELPAGEGLVARALRWGRRVMVGGELPADVRTIYLRVQARRGAQAQAGQYAQISYPDGTVTAQPLVKGFMGRSSPTETSALVLEPEEIPQEGGRIEYGKPSFEAEIRLPDIPAGEGPLVVRISWSVGSGAGPRGEGPGINPEEPDTWTVVPDQLDPTTPAPAVPTGKPTGPPPRVK